MTFNAFLLIIGYLCMGFVLGFFHGHGFGRRSGKIEGWVRAHVEIIAKIKQTKNVVERAAIFMDKKTVLVIEDNEDARQMLAAVLKLYGGYRVLEASTGDEGLQIALTEELDAAIIDIQLPGINGYEVARRIRAAENDVVLVALSGYDLNESTALDSGFNKYLAKPYDLDRLIESISV